MILEKLIELQDVRVVHTLQNTDFTLQLIFFILFKELFIYNFDCSECFGFFVKTFPHLSVRTYTF